MCCRVNVLDFDLAWNVETDRRVIEDGLYSSLDQLFSDFLRGRCWDREHGDLHTRLCDPFNQDCSIFNHKIANLLPDLGLVIIEYHRDAKAAIYKPLIPG